MDCGRISPPEGIGQRFVDAGLRYAAHAPGATGYVLAVAAFNERAIAVYRRAGFAESERYRHRTNGGEHELVRMARGRSITHGAAVERTAPNAVARSTAERLPDVAGLT